MSKASETGLTVARDALASVERQVEDRIDTASRLYRVAERKRAANDRTAALDRARAVRRVLGRASELLSDHDRYRDRLVDHVQSYPQIEDGVYHGHVRTYDDLVRKVDELERRIRMELAVARHDYDVHVGGGERVGDWEAAYDEVRETSNLLRHVRRHDLPDLVRTAEARTRTDVGRYLVAQGIESRLQTVRERMLWVEAADHTTVARNAASVNGELASDYLETVDRVRDRYTKLDADLAVVAAFVAGTVDYGDLTDRLSDETARRLTDRYRSAE